jgi:hypothetical protein
VISSQLASEDFGLKSQMRRASAEQAEVSVWLDFAKDFGYLRNSDYELLTSEVDEVGAMLHAMMDEPEKFTW